MTARSLRLFMRRALLFVMTVVLLAGLPVDRSFGESTSPTASEEDRCDCCPDRTPGDGEDCCDTDGGLCCATGSAAAVLPSHFRESPAPNALLGARGIPSDEFLRPRATDPPPTRPPIS